MSPFFFTFGDVHSMVAVTFYLINSTNYQVAVDGVLVGIARKVANEWKFSSLYPTSSKGLAAIAAKMDEFFAGK